MAEVVHITNQDTRTALSLIAGKRKCARCQGYTAKDDVWVLTNLRNEWILVKGTDVNKKVLCRECADDGLEARRG